MPTVPRYQSKQIPLGRSGVAMAHQAQANTIESFVQGIQGLKAGAINQVADASTQRAKQDAEKAFSEFGIKAKVNDELTVYGKQYTASLESMHVKQLAIDTNNHFEDLYKTEKDNPAKFEELANAYYKGTAKTLPAHLQADFAIDYEANKSRYSGMVSQNRIKLDTDKSIALSNTLYTQSYDNATQASRENDPIRATYEMDKAIKTLDTDLEIQTISADQYRKRVDDLKHSVSKANFKGVNDRNIERGNLDLAQSDIDTFRKTTIIGFNDEQRESLADEMQRDLDSEIRLRNNQSKTSSKFDNKMVKDQIFLLDNAEILTNEEIQKGLDSNASPDVKEKLLLALRDNKELAKFNVLSLQEQEKALNIVRNKKNKTADELRLQQKAEKFYTRAKKQIDQDPIMYGAGKAFKTEIRELDMQDESFMMDTKERISQARSTSEYTKKPVGFFTKGEVSSIKTRLPAMKITEKLDLINKINELPQDLHSSTYKQFGGEIEFAGRLSASGNKEGARISLMGKGADVVLEPGIKPEVMATISSIYGRNFAQNYHNMNVDGVLNYMKGISLGNEDISVSEAIEATLGKTATYNRKSLILPKDVEQDQFDMWLDTVVIEDNEKLTKGLNAMPDTFFDGDYQLHSTKESGKYIIKYINANGELIIERDPENPESPYILDYLEQNK